MESYNTCLLRLLDFSNQKYDYITKVTDYSHLCYYYLFILNHYSHEFYYECDYN
jgi:hypothetical protein